MVQRDLGTLSQRPHRPGKRITAAVVRYTRRRGDADDSESRDGTGSGLIPPPSLIDAWLLRRFPGRFLDEIDTQMDWARFMRAVKAEAVERVEDKRAMQLTGKLKAKDLSEDDWAAIKRHDEVLEAEDQGSGWVI